MSNPFKCIVSSLLSCGVTPYNQLDAGDIEAHFKEIGDVELRAKDNPTATEITADISISDIIPQEVKDAWKDFRDQFVDKKTLPDSADADNVDGPSIEEPEEISEYKLTDGKTEDFYISDTEYQDENSKLEQMTQDQPDLKLDQPIADEENTETQCPEPETIGDLKGSLVLMRCYTDETKLYEMPLDTCSETLKTNTPLGDVYIGLQKGDEGAEVPENAIPMRPYNQTSPSLPIPDVCKNPPIKNIDQLMFETIEPFSGKVFWTPLQCHQTLDFFEIAEFGITEAFNISDGTGDAAFTFKWTEGGQACYVGISYLHYLSK